MVNSLMKHAMWRTQEVLHGKSTAALPGSLLMLASFLLVYRSMLEDVEDTLETFLALIIIQMLPLAFLEMRILQCPDPVGLLCKFGSSVLLMHACFTSLRVIGLVGHRWRSGISLVMSIAALHVGFDMKFSLRTVMQHRNVWILAAMSLVAAFSQDVLGQLLAAGEWEAGMYHFCLRGSDFMEILSFVPAVWMVYRDSASDQDTPRVTVETAETKKKAVCFFGFLLAFYIDEDVAAAYNLWGKLPLASGGHLLHFLLLLDFACYVLAHIYNPEKFLDFKHWFSRELHV